MKTSRYPLEMALKDGTKVTIREMGPGDEQNSLDFFMSLPIDQRQYLRMDVTKIENIRARLNPRSSLCTWRLGAEHEGRIIADATLCGRKGGWTRHTREIRCIIHPDFKRKGLGSILIRELFQQAVSENVEFVFCDVVKEQTAAVAALESIGFKRALVRPNHVKDINGVKHDLWVFTKDVNEMWETLKNHMMEYDIPYRPA